MSCPLREQVSYHSGPARTSGIVWGTVWVWGKPDGEQHAQPLKSIPTLFSLEQPLDLDLLSQEQGLICIGERRGRTYLALLVGGADPSQNFEIVRLYRWHLPTSLSVLLLTVSSRPQPPSRTTPTSLLLPLQPFQMSRSFNTAKLTSAKC